MKIKIQYYKCEYNVPEINGGIWKKTESEKQLKFEQVETSFFNPPYTKVFIRKYLAKDFIARDRNIIIPKGNLGCIEKEDYKLWWVGNDKIHEYPDGTYVIYPMQCGTPYYFEPIDYVEIETPIETKTDTLQE